MRKFSPPWAAGIVLAAAVAAPAPLFADSACKGLEKTPCEAKDTCNWVNGYKRKDGVQVSGHCRSSPKKKGTSSTSSNSASDTKK